MTGRSVVFSSAVMIVYNRSSLQTTARLLAREMSKVHRQACRVIFSPTHIPTPIGNRAPRKKMPAYSLFSFSQSGEQIVVYLSENQSHHLPPSGYGLEVNADEKFVHIHGDAEGVFYGTRTLLQMMYSCFKAQPQAAVISEQSIQDFPKFGYRALHLDVARHFFSVQEVKKLIRIMSFFKLNYLHLHLSDDQGWRIAIPQYPRLTTVGSHRKQTIVGRDRKKKGKYLYDPSPHQGFYTTAQIHELIYYAKIHHITIVPEIDMPSHALAMIASYPFLACDSTLPYEVQMHWAGSKTPLCIGKESTYVFLCNILRHIAQLFPSPYIHIGQDEYAGSAPNCKDCNRMMEKHKVKTPLEYQRIFLKCIEDSVAKMGKKTLIWDDAPLPTAPPDRPSTLMVWKSRRHYQTAVQMGMPFIVCDHKAFYFDYYQSANHSREPMSFNGTNSLQTVYTYPIPKQALGGAGLLWTEYVKNFQTACFKLFPRLLAVAEKFWTDPPAQMYHSFLQRVYSTKFLLDFNHISYARFFQEELKQMNAGMAKHLRSTAKTIHPAKR